MPKERAFDFEGGHTLEDIHRLYNELAEAHLVLRETETPGTAIRVLLDGLRDDFCDAVDTWLNADMATTEGTQAVCTAQAAALLYIRAAHRIDEVTSRIDDYAAEHALAEPEDELDPNFPPLEDPDGT